MSDQSNFFEKNILVHTHIAKSSGTSLVDGLGHIFGKENIFNLNEFQPNQGVKILQNLPYCKKKKIKVLTGHFWYGKLDYFFERRPIYIATVREPISRFISLYKFIVNNPTHPEYEKFTTSGLEDAAHWFFSDPIRSNEIGLSLGINYGDDIEKILNNNYAIVAPYNRVNELISALSIFFNGAKSNCIFHENISKSFFELNENKKAHLQSLCINDSFIVSVVEGKFDDWIAEINRRITS